MKGVKMKPVKWDVDLKLWSIHGMGEQRWSHHEWFECVVLCIQDRMRGLVNTLKQEIERPK